jgi:hypothetical protein
MAKNILRTSELYERTTANGTVERRKFNGVSLAKSRIARQMVADNGWTKVAGDPVGVTSGKPKGQKGNAKPPVEIPAQIPDEQPEENVEMA